MADDMRQFLTVQQLRDAHASQTELGHRDKKAATRVTIQSLNLQNSANDSVSYVLANTTNRGRSFRDYFRLQNGEFPSGQCPFFYPTAFTTGAGVQALIMDAAQTRLLAGQTVSMDDVKAEVVAEVQEQTLAFAATNPFGAGQKNALLEAVARALDDNEFGCRKASVRRLILATLRAAANEPTLTLPAVGSDMISIPAKVAYLAGGTSTVAKEPARVNRVNARVLTPEEINAFFGVVEDEPEEAPEIPADDGTVEVEVEVVQ